MQEYTATIQFNSLFHFTQANTIYTDFHVIHRINKLYKISCCIHFNYLGYRCQEYACLVEIGKELAVCHAPPLKCVHKSVYSGTRRLKLENS